MYVRMYIENCMYVYTYCTYCIYNIPCVYNTYSTVCMCLRTYVEQTSKALDSRHIQLQPETLNWMPYMEEGQVVGQKLGEVDVSNGPQHEDVLVLVRVFQLQGSSTSWKHTSGCVCVCVCVCVCTCV